MDSSISNTNTDSVYEDPEFSNNFSKAFDIYKTHLKDCKINEESLQQDEKSLLQYRNSMLKAMKPYELNAKQKYFLWLFGLGGKVSAWYKCCASILQDEMYDYTLDQICTLIRCRFIKEGVNWNDKMKEENILANNNNELNNDYFENLQDIPHLNKIFHLIVEPTCYVKSKGSVHKTDSSLLETDLKNYNETVDSITETLKERGV
ncbi:hypothetical protein C6P44_000917 [Monosporozyma unispora]|nr:hypothetical protein C6P44_000917 [Kazachstania unispora]